MVYYKFIIKIISKTKSFLKSLICVILYMLFVECMRLCLCFMHCNTISLSQVEPTVDVVTLLNGIYMMIESKRTVHIITMQIQKKSPLKFLQLFYFLYFRILVEIKCRIIFFCVARRPPSVRRYHYPSDSSRLLPMYVSKVRMPGSTPGMVVAAEYPLQVLLTSKRSH